MIYGPYRHRIDLPIDRLRMNSTDGAPEKPGTRKDAHFFFARPLVGSKVGGAIGRLEATRVGSVIKKVGGF